MKLLTTLLALLWIGLVAEAEAQQTIAPTVSAIPIIWDTNTTVANGTVPLLLPPWNGGGKIISCSYYTTAGSFTATVNIGATAVTGCSAIGVSSSTPGTSSATANNVFTSASSLSLVITSASGSPNGAMFQVNIVNTSN